MQIKKAVAIGMGTLLAGASLAFAGLGQATDLSNVFPTTGTSALTASNTLIVVGAGVSSVDTVAGIDIGGRLGSTSTQTMSVPVSGGSNVNGIEKDGIGICTSTTSSSCTLATVAGTGAAFPGTTGSTSAGSVVLTNTHFTGLQKSTISWQSNNYDYSEKVDLSGVTMSHDATVNYVNGTETMVVGTGNVYYYYNFDKALNISSVNSKGTTASPEYTYPVTINMLGKPFVIVGVDSSGVKMLSGASGEINAKNSLTSGAYKVYAVQGVSDPSGWAKISVRDSTGTEVATKSITSGNSFDFSAQGITVKVTAVRAIGTTGEISGVDAVVGPIGAVEKTYTTTADVTSTGTANTAFPGVTDWGIQVGNLPSSGGQPGIPKGMQMQVVWKPTTTQYLKAGQTINFPNGYAQLGLEGYNTNRWATITVSPFGGTTTYDMNSTSTIVGSNLYGLSIASDTPGSIVSTAGNSYDKAYVLFNSTMQIANSLPMQQVWIGFYDKTSGKILTNATAPETTGAGEFMGPGKAIATTEYAHALLNATPNGLGLNNFTYPFKISYGGSGDASWYLNITVNGTNGIQSVAVGSMPVATGGGPTWDVLAWYTNKTASTLTSAPQFKLGTTAASSEDAEISATTSGSTGVSIGKKTQDILSDSEVLVSDTVDNGNSDNFVFKVPSKRLGAKIYFGLMGAATNGTSTYQAAVPVTTPTGKLTSDFTDASIQTTGKNLILVGGPCANRFVGQLMNVSADGSNCLTQWFAAIGATDLNSAKNMALLKVVQNAFQQGQSAVIVAGTDAKDTRNAAAKLIADGLTGTQLAYSTATSGSQ